MSRTTLAATAAALLALAASQSYADAPPADKAFADKAAAGGLAMGIGLVGGNWLSSRIVRPIALSELAPAVV